jgi:hypothetical protein
MSRAINASTKAAFATNGFRLATLIRIEFATTVYLTDYGNDLTVAGLGTFVNSPHFIEISGIKETGALRVNTLNFQLSGVEQSYVSIFLQQDYMDRRFRVWRAVVDENDSVVGDPFLYFDGRIVGFDIEDTERDSIVNVEVASHWRDFEKIVNRKTNHNSQQVHFDGDMGFEFASKMVKDLRWGRKG